MKPETKFLCVPPLAEKWGVESDFKNKENATQNIAYEIQPVFLPLYLSMGCYQFIFMQSKSVSLIQHKYLIKFPES